MPKIFLKISFLSLTGLFLPVFSSSTDRIFHMKALRRITRYKSLCHAMSLNLLAALTDVTEFGSGVDVSVGSGVVCGVVVFSVFDVRGNPHSNSNSARVINMIRQKKGKQAFLYSCWKYLRTNLVTNSAGSKMSCRNMVIETRRRRTVNDSSTVLAGRKF